jgi:chromatin structure-remodeling complex protein RSC7
VEDEEDEESEKPYRVRNRKSVSYREVPVDTEEYDEELSSAGEEEKSEYRYILTGLMKGTPPPRSSHVPDTPSRRRKASASASAAAATADSDTEKGDKPFVAEKEKVGSGRGGFSVKGAAAAAARARWAKVRLEKAERGEDDDNGKERKKGRIVRRENRAAVEKLKGESCGESECMLMIDGEVVTIRGVDYVVANDELPIPDDPKGETKIDHLGRLKGGMYFSYISSVY